MNDRLGDLPAWAMESDDEGEENNGNNNAAPNKQGGDIEMGQPKHMEHFFREVESIKVDIEAVTSATKAIGDINEHALQATTTEEENELSRKLRPLVDETNKRAKRTKTLLGLLKEETKKLQGEGKVKQSDLRYVSKRSPVCSNASARNSRVFPFEAFEKIFVILSLENLLMR